MGNFDVYYKLKHLGNVAVQLNSQPLPSSVRVCKINANSASLFTVIMSTGVYFELQLLSPVGK